MLDLPDPDAVMEYAGNGVWKRQITWDGDNRYRFDAVIDGTDYIWGYSSSDMSDSDMPSGLTGPQYRLTCSETGNINQWDYSFKHIAVLRNVTCTIVVDCSARSRSVLPPLRIRLRARSHSRDADLAR